MDDNQTLDTVNNEYNNNDRHKSGSNRVENHQSNKNKFDKKIEIYSKDDIQDMIKSSIKGIKDPYSIFDKKKKEEKIDSKNLKIYEKNSQVLDDSNWMDYQRAMFFKKEEDVYLEKKEVSCDPYLSQLKGILKNTNLINDIELCIFIF